MTPNKPESSANGHSSNLEFLTPSSDPFRQLQKSRIADRPRAEPSSLSSRPGIVRPKG